MASCGYCTQPFEDSSPWLPLLCRLCERYFHLDCLGSKRKPTALRGDQLFQFCCSFCSETRTETWSRLSLNWVHVIHLSLYNLMLSEGGREGFFRWNTGICKFIESHWFEMMPSRHKTSSWQCTVAGTLSVNCPSLFRSGTSVFGENGWWSLQEMRPPKLSDIMKTLAVGDRPKKGSKQNKCLSSIAGVTPDSRKRSIDIEKPSASKKIKEEEPELMPEQENTIEDMSSALVSPLTLQQERVLLDFMSSKVSSKDSSFARILRTLKVRETKRALGQPLFSMNAFVMESLHHTQCYISSSSDNPPYPLIAKDVESESTHSVHMPSFSLISKARAILRRLESPLLPHLICNDSNQSDNGRFISPYTSHLLPYIIFKSSSFLPPKIQIFKELLSKVTPEAPYEAKPIVFSYFQKDQLQPVNAFISYFFWPVDLSEYLQHPDFTVVVTYGSKLIIGCGFMTPDASISEAYIPFLLVHPDYQYAGIG
ncbi:PREDICTED: cysteine-rich protein 2-binding protein-like [Amphimedon queenslandica]|uniref:N-acetyltransferase domain-containing protein n=1 Tax=Amphimedon queenslandica TaxID=400682 RepID=A0A1X7VQG2_AMPQE|nr:PREDICTED: cysteine-rich protein 2-binding protein-like [Amphimedon queenslandica]|eukprot:XP_003383135.2 PREDICTED: cysteine-rich protein 2-binding protein-like [Amphimedon queenslandica]